MNQMKKTNCSQNLNSIKSTFQNLETKNQDISYTTSSKKKLNPITPILKKHSHCISIVKFFKSYFFKKSEILRKKKMKKLLYQFVN